MHEPEISADYGGNTHTNNSAVILKMASFPCMSPAHRPVVREAHEVRMDIGTIFILLCHLEASPPPREQWSSGKLLLEVALGEGSEPLPSAFLANLLGYLTASVTAILLSTLTDSFPRKAENNFLFIFHGGDFEGSH